MAHEPNDTALRRLFAALREAEARPDAPDFEATWARAMVHAARLPRFTTLRLVTAGALAAAAVLIVAVLRRPAQPAVVDVAGWHSPTAFLLRGPGDALLRDVPKLGSSAIPTITAPNVPGGTP